MFSFVQDDFHDDVDEPPLELEKPQYDVSQKCFLETVHDVNIFPVYARFVVI